MAQIGKNAEIYVSGWDMTTTLTAYSVKDSVGSIDTTAFGPTSDETSMPDSIRKGEVTLDGFYVQTPITAPMDATLRAANGTTVPALIYPLGSTAGNPGVITPAETLDYTVKQDVGDAVRTSVKSKSNAAQRVGQSLHANAPRTSPYTGANYDSAAAGELAAGTWVAEIQATVVTADLTVLVETSADGSTAWVTLTTFTVITLAALRGSEIKTGSGAIHRYRRIRATVGAGTFTVALHAA